MGKGKGPVEGWVAVVKAGRMLYEIEGVPEELAQGGVPHRGAQAAAQDTVPVPG